MFDDESMPALPAYYSLGEDLRPDTSDEEVRLVYVDTHRGRVKWLDALLCPDMVFGSTTKRHCKISP